MSYYQPQQFGNGYGNGYMQQPQYVNGGYPQQVIMQQPPQMMMPPPVMVQGPIFRPPVIYERGPFCGPRHHEHWGGGHGGRRW